MPDMDRLLARATSAFVDRDSIDWDALLTRARSEPARSVVRNLRFLDSVRPVHSATIKAWATYGPRAIWWVLVASIAQTSCAAIVLAAALASGEALRDRWDQAAIMVAFCAAGILLGTLSRDPRTLALLAWFTTVAGLFGQSAVHGLPEEWFSSVDFLFSGVPLETFAPACVWQFAIVFPRVKRFTRVDIIAARAAALCWLLGIALFTINLAAAYVSIEATPLAYLVRTRPINAYWEIVTLALIPAIGTILVRAKRAPLPERRRVARFALAIAGGTAPILLLGVVLVFRASAGTWVIDSYPAELLWPHRTVLGGLAATPILASLAVVIDRPFELRALLRARSALALSRALLAVAPLAAVLLWCRTLYQHRQFTIEQLLFSAAGAPLLLYALIACVLFATRARLLRTFDRLTSRRAAEHQAQLAQGLERIRLARGTREIAAVLEREFRRGTGASAVAVMSPNRAGDFIDWGHRLDALTGDSALVAVLRETGGPVDVSDESELRRLLPDREWVVTNDVALIVPLKHRDEELAAIIAIGPKRRGLPFDRRDLWLIATLTTAAAAAWSEAERRTDPRATPDALESGSESTETASECPRCGVVASGPVLPCACGVSPVLAALPLRLRDSLLVQRRLGKGGMGVVYLAHDMALDRDVALKTLPRLGPGAVPRLRGEARAMGTLNHESLATIYDVDLWRRTPVLIVEYFPRGTLATRLARGPISPMDAVSLGIALARALAYMHARGMLHRDIKPSNIAFTATGAPKLLDFGLAVLTEPPIVSGEDRGAPTRDAPRAGTIAYLPPEAFNGARPSARYDLWALALVLMESATGLNPSAGRPNRTVAHPDLSHVLERALDPEPERRFQAASELLAALEAIHVPTT